MANPHLKHKHDCKHELVLCAHCDAVFCTRCEREWLVPCAQNHYPWTTTYTTPTTYPQWPTKIYGNQITCQTPAMRNPIDSLIDATPHAHMAATG